MLRVTCCCSAVVSGGVLDGSGFSYFSYHGVVKKLPPSQTALNFDSHEQNLRRLARHLVANEADADDLVQETWLQVLRQPNVKVTKPKAWIGTILRNQWKRTQLRRMLRKDRELQVREWNELEESEPSCGLEDQQVLRAKLEGWMQGLAERQAHALRLRYFENKSIAEIALAEGVTESTVRTWLSRGIERMRTRLDERYGERWPSIVMAYFGLKAAASHPKSEHSSSFNLRQQVGLFVGGVIICLVLAALPWGEALGRVTRVVDPLLAEPLVQKRHEAQPSDREGKGGSLPTMPDESVSTVAVEKAARAIDVVVLESAIPLPNVGLWVSEPESKDRGRIRAYTDSSGRARLEGISSQSWIRPEWEGCAGVNSI